MALRKMIEPYQLCSEPPEKILHSGDLPLIVQTQDLDTILEHFGEDSFEYLTYEHNLADNLWQEKKDEKFMEEKPKIIYQIPGMTENPALNHGTCKRWIRNFCNWNKIKLPLGFEAKNKKQLQGLFYGMLEYYKISLEKDILPPKI